MAGRKDAAAYKRYTYEDGNTVRHIEVGPDYHTKRKQRREERELADRKRRHRRAARRNRERALAMNPGYVGFLTACVLALAVTSATVINLQSTVTMRQRNIASLEGDISDLKIDNDTSYKRIETAVNLKEIKKQAKKLGMRYPSEKQIVYYTIDNSDYMTQYSH